MPRRIWIPGSSDRSRCAPFTASITITPMNRPIWRKNTICAAGRESVRNFACTSQAAKAKNPSAISRMPRMFWLSGPRFGLGLTDRSGVA